MTMGTMMYIIIAIAIGFVVIVAINKSRKPSPPITLGDALANQTKVINNYMSFDPGLKDIFKEAIRDGVTHIQHAPQDDTIAFTRDDTIAFYRVHEGFMKNDFYFSMRERALKVQFGSFIGGDARNCLVKQYQFLK
jgi:hypothetical protein